MAQQTRASLYRSRRPSAGKKKLSRSDISHNVWCMVTYHNLQARQISNPITTVRTQQICQISQLAVINYC